MRGLPGRRLWVPAVLSFSSVVGCPSGGDDVADDGSSSAADSTSAATMTTTATTSTATTAAESSSGESSGATESSGAPESSSGADASSSETGEPAGCFDIRTQAECMAESTCVYLGEFGGCVRNCEMITDLTECAATQFCVVYGETCGYEPVS